jgi:hypothetical protein
MDRAAAVLRSSGADISASLIAALLSCRSPLNRGTLRLAHCRDNAVTEQFYEHAEE